MKFSPHLCYLVPFRSKYPPQRPILKHPQPTFPPQCRRPSSTLIQNTNRLWKCKTEICPALHSEEIAITA
jgi:hypothetical protein